jgi:hypothetical protein
MATSLSRSTSRSVGAGSDRRCRRLVHVGVGQLRFCRSQYHHMNHASRAQTSQGARNITACP